MQRFPSATSVVTLWTKLSEDDLKDAEKDVQELTDKYTKLIDKAVKEKEQEVMSL